MSMTFLWNHLWDSAFSGVALMSSLPHPMAWASQDPGCKHASRWQPERRAPTWTAVQIYFTDYAFTAPPLPKCSCYQEKLHPAVLCTTLPASPLHLEAILLLASSWYSHWFFCPPEKFSAFSQYKIINTTRFLGLQHVPCWILWEAEAADSPSGKRAARCVWNNKRGEKRERQGKKAGLCSELGSTNRDCTTKQCW